ncbi:hypothetical protein BDZ45DRAFT_627362 [Acephala macrosclerotiorum]|nr:hypothetical protein BDZ45DRAFT_627362 [Acephala macrosclerotiorum]
MRHTSLVCQICSVPFSIGRIRTFYEPESCSWDSRGFQIFEQDPSASLCSIFPKESGCSNVKVRGGDVLQHIAGMGCIFEAGYSGHRIGVEEMRGMGRCRYLVRKPKRNGVGDENEDSESEEEKEYEKDSEYFFTAPTTHIPLSDITKTLKFSKYGVLGSDFCAKNCPAYQSWPSWDDYPMTANWIGIPVHSACWKIFEKVSKQKLGRGDIDGFVALWARERTEYLAANPVDVPGFRLGMMGVYKEESPLGDGAFCVEYDEYAKGMDDSDPFKRLPSEVKNVILAQLCSRDIASLRLASRCFRQLPKALFRRLIKDEMPWFWEIDDLKRAEEEYLCNSFEENYGAEMLEVSGGIDPNVLAFVKARMERKCLNTNWLQVYKQLKVMEKGVLGVRNRTRIWKVVEDIVERIEKMSERAAFPGAVAGVDFPIYASWSGRAPGSEKSHYDCPRCE